MDDHNNFVLRSSDGLEFDTSRAVLIAASPVFRDMSSFVPPGGILRPTLETPDEDTDVVTLSEHSSIVEMLLSICHLKTFDSFSPTNLDKLVDLHKAVDKYQMDTEKMDFGSVLRRFIDTQPYRVYAIACIWGMEDIARAAALASLKHRVFSFKEDIYIPELIVLPAAQLHLLCEFRYRYLVLARAEILQTISWESDGDYWGEGMGQAGEMGVQPVWTIREGHAPGCGPTPYHNVPNDITVVYCADWANMHLRRVADALAISNGLDTGRDPIDIIQSTLCFLETAELLAISNCTLCLTKGPEHLRHLCEALRRTLSDNLQNVNDHTDIRYVPTSH